MGLSISFSYWTLSPIMIIMKYSVFYKTRLDQTSFGVIPELYRLIDGFGIFHGWEFKIQDIGGSVKFTGRPAMYM